MNVETKNASLDTLSVTILALHVNGKQMTLAVFKQLPVACAYLEDGALDESLSHWGLVRYEIKDQGAIWSVASRGGHLYRCRVDHAFGNAARLARQISGYEIDLANFIGYTTYQPKLEAAQRQAREGYEKAVESCPIARPEPHGWLISRREERIPYDEQVKARNKWIAEHVKPETQYKPNPYPCPNHRVSLEDIERLLSESRATFAKIEKADKAEKFMLQQRQLFIAV